MKKITIITAFLFLLVLNATAQSEEQTTNPASTQLFSVEIYNYEASRETPVSKTVYNVLTQTISKDVLCEGTHIVSDSAYKEVWVNERLNGSPVWALNDNGFTEITADQAISSFCGVEKAVYSYADVKKFPMMIERYPAFK